ncbi:hypothetical protein KEM55_006670, partial [Ascosphaera atra]
LRLLGILLYFATRYPSLREPKTNDALHPKGTDSEKPATEEHASEEAVEKSSEDAKDAQDAAENGDSKEEAEQPKEDVDQTKEVDGPSGTAAEEPATPAPQSAKKASSSKRKSSGGGGGKRKSMNRTLHLDAKPGDYYIARLKSWPPWPAIICDEEMLPPALTAKRPVTTKQEDGSYHEAYADGGKRVYERTYPMMFLGSNEFAWICNTDITPLNPADCKDVSEKGKGKALIEAFRVASEGHGLDYFKKLLSDHQAAIEQEEEAIAAAQAEKERKAQEKAERAAAKAATQKKGKRKSTAATDNEDDEEVSEKKSSAKKRKKDVDSDADNEAPAKTPKGGMKLKLTTPKAPADKDKEEASTKKAGAGAASAKGSKAKGKKAAEKKEADGKDAAAKEEDKKEAHAQDLKEQAKKRRQLGKL